MLARSSPRTYYWCGPTQAECTGEAAFAMISGTAPIPATKTYIERRTTEGKPTPEIRRCLKRHVARQTYRILQEELDET